MTAITGGRGLRSFSSEGVSSIIKLSSTSASATRLTVCPKSSTTSCAVSASSISFMVAIVPCCIKYFTTSRALSAMRFDNSDTVMASGIITSRCTLSRSPNPPRWRCFSLSLALLTEASDLWRSSSPANAVTIVSLPLLLLVSPFDRVGGGAARFFLTRPPAFSISLKLSSSFFNAAAAPTGLRAASLAASSL